ncbi:unnamed protein product [Phaedon cochleariae]|uniref:Ig-like domain-containing protein n=1 Tax=Phaedon cochleariae TaxID=80249 RepID=A0A9N9S7I6_PHACE|nr:unnamed protein product [Phaedon cochleariae]
MCFDVRGRQSTQAKLWSSPDAFGPRAFFRASTNPAALLIDNIHLSDEGVYRCRVDFKNSPTRNSKVNFTIIVPPTKIFIYDDHRIEKSNLVGPYNEGSDVNLICEVRGGLHGDQNSSPGPVDTTYSENMRFISTILGDTFESSISSCRTL